MLSQRFVRSHSIPAALRHGFSRGQSPLKPTFPPFLLSRQKLLNPRSPRQWDHSRPFSHTSPLSHPFESRRRQLASAKPILTTQQIANVAKSRKTHTFVLLCIGAAVVFYYSNIQTVPVSGRRRFNCYGDGNTSLTQQQVKRVIYEVEQQGSRFLPDWDPRTVLVKRVMNRLIPVSGLTDYEWEVYVIDDPNNLNAFVLPGGKVFVFSGILRVTRTESGLATVLGHEVAHNLAQHHGERQSAAIGTNILLYSMLFLFAPIGALFLPMQVFMGGLLDLLFERPMGRLQESEADYIGLMLMAEACYDPREAVGFWKRMDSAAHQMNQGDIPEWISTHPSNQNRIEKITEWMPKAMEKKEQSDCSGSFGFADLFMEALRRGQAYTG